MSGVRIRVLCYNIRHAQGIGGLISNPRLARVITDAHCDVAALTEVWRIRGRYDQPELLARLTGLNTAFDPVHTVFGRESGNVVLSRTEVGGVQHIDLGGGREKRGCMLAEVEANGVPFLFGATHLSLGRDMRRQQIELLARELPRDRPLVLAGDFNCCHVELRPLLEVLEFPDQVPATFPSPMPLRSLDHIGFSLHWRLISLETVRSWASDHLPLLAELEYVGE